ncbi:hypothetical protein NH288_04520 [Anaerococcus sp. NML200537]|uniref:LURP-one-related/scramblase family protein n=1 Tax=Anaerococcus sp. NML200537 TaxID=2954485 RepID=UPI00223741C0|nr:hypothetical protein [Anaerococcus sp. NML200537]MCW6701346.1 hypothetical protein [Anaerococcus sp. NML200537]
MKKYYFKEKFFKITDKYWIMDENNDKAFYLDQDFTFFGYRSRVFDKDMKEAFKVERKILSFLPTYFVDFKDGSQMTIKSRLSFLRRKVDIETDFGTIYLKGSIWDYNFDISLDGKKIGEISKVFFAMTDQYELRVLDEDYTEAMLALVICLNNIKDSEAAAAANSANN